MASLATKYIRNLQKDSQYLNATFHHHMGNRQEAIIFTGVQRAKAVCDHNSHTEMEFPKRTSSTFNVPSIHLTASTWAITFFYKTTASWRRELDTWTISSGKQLRLSFIPTTQTGKKPLPSSYHGSPQFMQ